MQIHIGTAFKYFLPMFFLLFNACINNTNEKVPNILFIAVDDLRPELGIYGNDYVITPHIDQLAKRGAIFDRAYCSVSWCAPSRTALMTGMRPQSTGVMDLSTHFRSKIPDAVTMPQFFKQKGYTSLGFGKLYHNDIKMQDDQSWSQPCWIPEGTPILAYASEENKQIAEGSTYHKATVTEAANVPDNAYPDGQITNNVINALHELKSAKKPFFLGVGYYKPHLPFTAPKKYWDLYNREDIPLSAVTELPENASPYIFRSWSETGSYTDITQPEPYSDTLSLRLKHGYFACVSYIDAQIGRLLDELKTLDLDDNTIVVIWGDHGWKLGEYGRWSKHSNMEIDTRVPLIVYVPGKEPRAISGIVETIDIYPTLVEMAGFNVSEELEGENLFYKKRDFALSAIPRDSVTGYSVRTNEFRYTEWRMNSEPQVVISSELYNHRENDQELENIVAKPQYSKQLESLKQILK